MVEYPAQALKQTSREATIPLYSPALDPQLQKITEPVDRMFCIYEGERAPMKGREKAEAKMPGDLRSLKAYSRGGCEDGGEADFYLNTPMLASGIKGIRVQLRD